MIVLRRRIEELMNGKFEYQPPALQLSKNQVKETVEPGEGIQGQISLGAADGRKLRGFLTSDNRRILTNLERFQGTAVTFVYGVDTAGLQPGDEVQGNLCLTTNVGETRVPVQVRIARSTGSSAMDRIRTIEDFAELASRDFREAYRMFRDPAAFAVVLGSMNDREKALYEGMSQNPMTYQHLEEFLVGMGCKEPVSVSLKTDSVKFMEVQGSIQESFLVKKAGWGRLSLEVETEGEFLEVHKRTLHEEDFIGSIYELDYVIRGEKLGKGRNFGRIILRSPYEELAFTVAASRYADSLESIERQEKKYRLRMLRDYLALRCHKLDYKSWITQGRALLEEVKAAGLEYPEYQMYEAYMDYEEENTAHAKEILKEYLDKIFVKEELELAGIYVYLGSMLGLFRNREQVVQRLHNFYLQKENSFALFWAWSQLDEEMKNSPSKMAFAMEELFEKGCNCPLLYLEAWNLISGNISLLRRAGGLWTQVFLFAGREHLLTEEFCMRLAYLSGYEKHFSRSLYHALEYAYEAFPSDDTLEAICKYIMKGNPRKPEYFRWFSLAVERGLRVTRIFEYYMETLDLSHQRELPKTLLLYFTYNSSGLGDTRKAFLFANMIANKGREPDIYASYRQKIEEFAAAALAQGKINEDYAVIYQEFSMNPQTPEAANEIGKMLYTHRLYCGDSRIRRVIVRHSQIAGEEVYPCIRGVAYPRIYTEDAVILFQDEKQIRYAATVNYNKKKLLDERDAAKKCLELGAAQPGLYLCACCDQEITGENLELFRTLADMEGFSQTYRKSIKEQLLKYYEDHLDEDAVEDGLGELRRAGFAEVDKKRTLELLIDGGCYQDAYKIIQESGCEGVASEKLLKLVSRRIIGQELEEEEELLALAGLVYDQGKYDEVILSYLLKYTKGPVDRLLKLWSSARAFRMDTFRIEERILELLMYTWDYRPEGSQVFRAYVRQTGKEQVVVAYLTFAAYGAFIHRKKMDSFMEKCLGTACQRNWKVDLVCRLAYLEVLAGKKKLTGTEEQMAEQILAECAQKKMAFGFFRRLPKEMLGKYQLADKTFVEYRGVPQERVALYYSLNTGFGTKADFHREPMNEVYPGVFLKAFTLFYGETLHYYFQTEREGQVQKTAIRTFSMNRIDENSRSKYQSLNRVLSAWKLGQSTKAARLLSEYLRKEQYQKSIFTIKKEL